MPRDRRDHPQPWYVIYKKSFERFLTSTDEKSVILDKVTQDIATYKPRTFLDIGAGNGELSIPLSRQVPDYTAIEANPSFASILRENRVRVIQGIFPFPLAQRYDYVLASHSTTYVKGHMEEMVLGAWNAVELNGRLTVVTLARRDDEDWKRLMDNVGLRYGLRHPDGHDRMLGLLEELGGSVDLEKVTTHIQTESLDQMVEALSFLGSNALESAYRMFMDQSPHIAEILDADYRDRGGYRFPIEHYFYRTQRVI